MVNKQELLAKLKTLAAQAANERHKAVDFRLKQHEIDNREAYLQGIWDAIHIVEQAEDNK